MKYAPAPELTAVVSCQEQALSSPGLCLTCLHIILSVWHRDNAYSHLEFDLGNLSAFDPSPVDAEDFTPLNRSSKCLEVATAMTQALVSQLFALPSEAVQGGRLAHLPAPSTALPREKPIPKAKPLTKWQKFAQVTPAVQTAPAAVATVARAAPLVQQRQQGVASANLLQMKQLPMAL
jgi:hypothetical protein